MMMKSGSGATGRRSERCVRSGAGPGCGDMTKGGGRGSVKVMIEGWLTEVIMQCVIIRWSFRKGWRISGSGCCLVELNCEHIVSIGVV